VALLDGQGAVVVGCFEFFEEFGAEAACDFGAAFFDFFEKVFQGQAGEECTGCHDDYQSSRKENYMRSYFFG
jgi:hypothetical protein